MKNKQRFVAQLAGLQRHLQSGKPPFLLQPETMQELMGWLRLLAQYGRSDALYEAWRKYAKKPFWTGEASAQVGISLLANGFDAKAGSVVDDCTTTHRLPFYTVAHELLDSSLFQLAERWVLLLQSRWDDETRPRILLARLDHHRGFFQKAVDQFEPYLGAHPDDENVRIWLASAQHKMGCRSDAINTLQPLLVHPPESTVTKIALASLLNEVALWPELLFLVRETEQQANNTLSVIQQILRAQAYAIARMERVALADFARLEAESPDPATVMGFRSLLYYRLGKYEEMLRENDRMTALYPLQSMGDYNRSHVLFLLGRYEEAWQAWESRFQSGTGMAQREHNYSGLKVWDGAVTPEMLVIHTEQGLGDVIQMLRYLPDVISKVGGLTFDFAQALYALLGALSFEDGEPDETDSPRVPLVADGFSEVSPDDALEPPPLVPTFQLPMMSLPRVLNKPLPEGSAYFSLNSSVIERTKPWLIDGGLRVGLVWAGNAAHLGDHFRSVHLLELMPLGRIPGIEFYILQKGPVDIQLDYLPSNFNVVRIDQRIDDLADLAGVIAQMDLLISVDSMPVHLAGALGKPVWALIPFTPDWRWGTAGEKTDWYDSVVLFRQNRVADWRPVITRMCEWLEKLSGHKAVDPKFIEPNSSGAVHEQLIDAPFNVLEAFLRAADTKADPKTSLSLLNEIAAQSQRPAVLGVKARLEIASGLLEAAETTLNHLIKVDNKHVGAMLTLSRLLLARDDVYGALRWASEAMHLGSDVLPIWRHMQDLFERQGMVIEAQRVAERISILIEEGAHEDWFGWGGGADI
ncbi:tetratricopeptide repeat protein [Andreprevotia chitinilytica]|uniref:tetratricopeptide repeat protein n=1 Tax=Andreprevotia chitinilytica TaxID=396808 RepID=UPI0005554D8F|nr:tetratricopeptide repeat protein [Andreprevotia chitinilytica]